MATHYSLSLLFLLAKLVAYSLSTATTTGVFVKLFKYALLSLKVY